MDLVLDDIMEEWKEYKLGDLCSKVCSGGTPSSRNQEYYDGDIPWLNTKEIDFNRIYSTEKYITEEGLSNSSAKWIPANSVIIAMYGATAGKTAINKIPLTTNQACCNLTINPQIADYNYIYYFLSYKYVELSSLANGGAQQNLNAQIIKDFEVQLPPLSKQDKIVSILKSLDDKIENNRRINENLEQQAQALFKSWFVDFEPFKNGKFVESELGLIPERWRVGTIGDYCKVRSGFAFKSSWWTESGCKVIKIKNISETGEINLIDCSYVNPINTSKAKEFKAKAGDLIIAMTGATIGKFNIIPIIKEDYFINQRVGKFFLGEKPLNKLPFIYCLLKQDDIKNSVINKGQGSAQPNISGNDIESIPIIIPTNFVIDAFNLKCISLFQDLLNNWTENNNLAELRDTLLPRLMSGELKVNEIENNI